MKAIVVIVLCSIVSVAVSQQACTDNNGNPGTCIDQSTCTGTITHNQCPGTPDNILCCTLTGGSSGGTSSGNAQFSVSTSVAGKSVYKFADGSAIWYTAGVNVDADGAPMAYGPNGKGLDYLANAGHPGNWWGIVTVGGQPVIQGPNDPAPGYYVSTTSLEDPSFATTDPRRYVDASSIPFIVLPSGRLAGAKTSDYCLLINLNTQANTSCIVADAGPAGLLGEISIAAAEAVLGAGGGNAKTGGTESKIIRYIVFPNSGNGRPATMDQINSQVSTLYNNLSPAQQTAAST